MGIRLAKWKTTLIIALITSFVIITPALAKWSDHSLLPSMASLNIFELTRDLVNRTDEMLQDTEHLQKEVAKASGTLDALDEQDQLLTSQIETNHSIHKELKLQLAGNEKARELMKQILTREENTYSFTQQVANRANNITGQMSTTVDGLKKAAVNTGNVGTNTKKLNSQMDALLVQLDQSVKNFHFIARITDALSYLKNKTGIDLPKPDANPKKEPGLPDFQKPLENLLHPIIPDGEKKKQDDQQDGGLLDFLFP